MSADVDAIQETQSFSHTLISTYPFTHTHTSNTLHTTSSHISHIPTPHTSSPHISTPSHTLPTHPNILTHSLHTASLHISPSPLPNDLLQQDGISSVIISGVIMSPELGAGEGEVPELVNEGPYTLLLCLQPDIVPVTSLGGVGDV